MCQWGFDDEANHLLTVAKIPAIRWVGGVDMELLAITTGGSIISRFEDITSDKLGHAKTVKEFTIGVEKSPMTIVESKKPRKQQN